MEAVAHLSWHTRHPSWRLLVLSAAQLVPAGLLLWFLPRWALVPAVVAGGLPMARTWLLAETSVRRRYQRVGAGEEIVSVAASVAGRFGLLRVPVVLRAPDLGSTAAAVDTFHPGSTVLVTDQMIQWARSGRQNLAAAVLAHELSHLHRWHVPLRLLTASAALAATSALLATVGVDAALGVFGRPPVWAAPFYGPGPAPLWVLGVPLVPAVVFAVFGCLASRCGEFDADADAAHLGFGPALAEVLSAAGPPRRLLPRGWRTHPSPAARRARLNPPGRIARS